MYGQNLFQAIVLNSKYFWDNILIFQYTIPILYYNILFQYTNFHLTILT